MPAAGTAQAQDSAYSIGITGGTFGIGPEGGFRLSAGFRIDKNKIRLKASPTQAVEISDDLYTPTQFGTLSGHVKAKEFAPVLILGYGGRGRALPPPSPR